MRATCLQEGAKLCMKERKRENETENQNKYGTAVYGIRKLNAYFIELITCEISRQTTKQQKVTKL
jgi:hypothetical protein